MSCDVKNNTPIIHLVNLTRIKNKCISFVGTNVPLKTITSLEKLKSTGKFTSTIEGELSSFFTKQTITSLKSIFSKYKISQFEYVRDFIRLDDTITNVKQKIFYYLSNISKKKYYLENNLELWIKNKSNIEYLGNYYIDANFKPSIYNKFGEIDYEHFISKKGLIINYYNLTQENNECLYDKLLKDGELIDTICFTNMFDELNLLNQKNVKIDDFIKFGYLKKYYPKYKIEVNSSKIKEKYEEIKLKLDVEKYSYELIDSVNFKKEFPEYKPCIFLNINLTRENYLEDDNKLNLFSLFNKIRNYLSKEIPFIKYYDQTWLNSYIAIYDKAIKSGDISKETIKSWLFNIKQDKFTGELIISSTNKGLTFKKLYSIENKKSSKNDKLKYYTINIYRNGKVELKLNFDFIEQANINTIQAILKDAKSLFDKLNQIDYREKKSKDGFKLKIPEILVKNNEYYLADCCDIQNLQYQFNYVSEKRVDFSKFTEFLLQFKTFIVEKLTDEKRIDFTQVKYRRVSNFKNMPEVYSAVTELIETGGTESDAIQLIKQKYERSITDAKDLFIDWKKRYASTGLFKTGLKQSGIDIRIRADVTSLTDYRVVLNGVKNFYTFVEVYKFLKSVLYIYENYKDFSKNKDFKKYILNIKSDIIFEEEEEEEQNFGNLNLEELNKIENMSNLSNINVGNYLQNNSKQKFKNVGPIMDLDLELAPDNLIDDNITIAAQKCIPNLEIDSCADLCEDRNYVLRRLQRYDHKLFHLKDRGKQYKTFSTYCQKQRQPIVMATNPEEDPTIDREAFTYAIKAGSTPQKQYYYICPEVWDPYVEKPVSIKSLKNIRNRITKDGICSVGTSPYGDYEILIKSEPDQKYPGFIDPNKHPDGLCMPCCFNKPQNNPKSSKYKKFQSCQGLDVNTNVKNTDKSVYILDRNKIPLDEKRYGLLPVAINKIFKTNCSTGFLPEGDVCYLRKGVKQSNNTFLQTIADIISTPKKVITLEDLISILVKNCTEKIFNSLNNGSLKIIFKNRKSKNTAYENYLIYLQTNEITKEENYVWDLISKPGVISKDGLNVIIFSETKILCPVGINSEDFYDKNKETIFIIKQDKFFEPIYKVSNFGSIFIEKFFSTDKEESVDLILNTLDSFCEEKYDIEWSKVLKDNEKILGFELFNTIKDDITLKKIVTDLKDLEKKDKKYKIKHLIKDSYNKCIAIQLDNGGYIPIRPRSCPNQYISVTKPDLINYSIQKKIIDNLLSKTDLSLKYIAKIINNDKKIIGIFTNTGRIIPTKETTFVNDGIPIKPLTYYPDANKLISENGGLTNKRLTTIQKKEFENETYQRLRFEISKYLLTKNGQKYKDDIYKTIFSNDKITNKRADLTKLIEKLIKHLTSDKKQIPNLDLYKKPNERVACFLKKGDCDIDPHCVKTSSGKCKLFLPKVNLILAKNNIKLYTIKITEELLTNKTKRDEIVMDNVLQIIDPMMIEPVENEILFFGRDNIEILKDIDKLSKTIGDLLLSNKNNFNTKQPNYSGINLDKYIDKTISSFNVALEPVSKQWNDLLGEGYKLFYTNNLFNALRKVFKSNSNSNVNKSILNNLRNYLYEYILKVSSSNFKDYFKLFGLKNKFHESNIKNALEIYKKLNPELFKKINSDLFETYIKSQNYPGSLFDFYMFSKVFNTNFIIIQKRITKDNLKGYYCILNEKSNKYVIFQQKISEGVKYYLPVVKGNRFIFMKDELSKEFQKKVDCFNKNE